MKINHLIEDVTGSFDTETGTMVCVPTKQGEVLLCFRDGMNIPFAKVKLHSRDLSIDADAVKPDATALGKEIARRWNAFSDDSVIVSLKRPEGYEGVDRQIVAEDAIKDNWPEYTVFE